MPLLINGKKSVESWVFSDPETLTVEQIAVINKSDYPLVLPFAFFIEHRDLLNVESDNLGISVTGDDDLALLLESLESVSLVAIDFPVLRDGRGFSIARSISRKGFNGEIRATGDVGFDRLDYMHRSGFNAYQITDEQYTDEMVNAFTEISVNYQPTHSR